MKLAVNEGMYIRDIQKEFNETYPFLKIELFKHKHGTGELSPKKERLDPYTIIPLLNGYAKKWSLDISKHITVSEFEKEFWEKTGVAIQVFRKSRNLWIETSLTDNWTLEKQNELAASFAHPDERTLEQKMEDQRFDGE
jgi:hypothetical protein